MSKTNLPTVYTPNIAPYHDQISKILDNIAANRKKKEGTPKKGA